MPPQERKMTAREDMAPFYCRLCSKPYGDYDEFVAHGSSNDHLYYEHLNEIRTDARDLVATEPDEPLLSVTYAERDTWSEMWPQRLLFVPEMRSYERKDRNRYGSVIEPSYNILSYTWGRWQDATGQVQSLGVEGIEWKIPAIQPHVFTVEEFAAILHEISSDVDWLWVDVACIDQDLSSDIHSKARDEEVGRQAGIFARASTAFIWLHQSPTQKLQNFANELFGLSSRCGGDNEYVTHTDVGDMNDRFGIDYQAGIFPNCVLDKDWLDRVGRSLSILEDEPWFSSLWTLQESLLRPEATILSREGHQLTRQGYLEVGLASFQTAWGNIEVALQRTTEILAASGEEHKHILKAAVDILARIDALGFRSHDNPVIIYSTAGYRKTFNEEDRIYGIMQVFGMKLGKSSNPGMPFSLAELEVQFAAEINKKSPVWGQLYIHGTEQPVGRRWCISQSSRMPQCLVMDVAIARSQCRIAVDAGGKASFNGLRCSFQQLKAAWDATRDGPFIRNIWNTEAISEALPVELILLDENDEVLRTIPKDMHRLEKVLDDRHRQLSTLLESNYGNDLRVLYCGTIDDGDEISSEESETDDEEIDPCASVEIPYTISITSRNIWHFGAMSSLWAQFWAARYPPADPTHLSYQHKTVLVTGANSGLGYAAAVKYAALGANPLILVVRTQEKGDQARENIMRDTGCSPNIFLVEIVDFASFDSVQACAQRLNSHPRAAQLHVAQLAAGVAQWQYEKSPDGFEITLQVNVLSQALLALLLLRKMRTTAAAVAASDTNAAPHLSFLHSIAGFEVTADWIPYGQSLVQRCNDPSKWDPTKQYYLAKLALWNVIEGLVQRESQDEQGRKIIINASCPSGCKTNMGRNFPGFVKPILAVQHFFCGRSAEQGARTLVGATALGAESHGKLWRNDTLHP
ncbi:hypothetical protein N0V82_007767 [Gnomoniopsis sp. IMI 355080]|nr:hypothetical protein N0V82_007767 [Gnomoniopsis sp. IMI 355080]